MSPSFSEDSASTAEKAAKTQLTSCVEADKHVALADLGHISNFLMETSWWYRSFMYKLIASFMS